MVSIVRSYVRGGVTVAKPKQFAVLKPKESKLVRHSTKVPPLPKLPKLGR